MKNVINIRNLDGTFIFDNKLKWSEYESPSFVFKHLNNKAVLRDIRLIAEKREKALSYISDFLGIRKKVHFTIYIVPDFKYFYSFGISSNCSIPHEKVACIVYDDFPFSHEKIACGHEITHLIVYHWDEQTYHIEFLEEGLARYLDQSGLDSHYFLLNKIGQFIGKKTIDFSLKVAPIPRKTDYEKAGSFVKFLIEEYGMEKFKEIYLASVLERKNNIFYVNGKKLPAEFLEKLLEEKLDTPFIEIQRNWLSCIGIHL